ncbi:MAG TPA: hypothetical protein VL337_14495 [Acidimicrobiales bacterium]|jgi:hypothetical protein|nr:hypothetical protein [Acidimicrobiales bacterium]
MQNPSNAHPGATSGAATTTHSGRRAVRRRWVARVAVFGGGVLAVLAMAAPAMAWPAMGC